MSLPSSANLAQNLDAMTGVKTSDQINPIPVRDVDAETTRPRLQQESKVVDAPVQEQRPDRPAELKPITEFKFETTADALYPFRHFQVLRQNRKSPSWFYPCAIMLMYWVHEINVELSRSFDFKRNTPEYHPLTLNIYFAILFYIQILRCQDYINDNTDSEHQFLVKFVSAFPLASLRIPGPLLPIFKAICVSQPENKSFGYVYPKISSSYGPTEADEIGKNSSSDITLPNVPLMLAIFKQFISDNSTAISTSNTGLPKGWTPWYGAQIDNSDPTHPTWKKAGADFNVTLNGYTYRADTHLWSNAAAWSLVSPGLQFPIETDAKHHSAFHEYESDYQIPNFSSDTDLSHISDFLGMDASMLWFRIFRSVAANAALSFEGSGSLADCSVFGPMSTQVQICYSTPDTLPVKPQKMADSKSLFPYAFVGRTTSTTMSNMHEIQAAASHINVRMFKTHPYAGSFGNRYLRTGKFWDIRPIYSSAEDDESWIGINETVKAMKINRPFK